MATAAVRATAPTLSGRLRMLPLVVVLATAAALLVPVPATGAAAAAACACTEVGDYKQPAGVRAPYVGDDGSSAAEDPRYRVSASGSAGSVNLVVRRTSDDAVVLSTTTSATHWGFSPDQDRFVTHRSDAVTLEVRLHDLTAPSPATPVLQRTVTTGDARVGFSRTGRWFALTHLVAVDRATTFVADARTGATAHTGTYTFHVPPGSGKKYGEAAWGFSPDDGEFVVAWLTGQDTVQMSLVDLVAGEVAWSHQMTGVGFWHFSPCGSLLALVEQRDQTSMATRLVDSADGSVVATRTDPVSGIAFRATETHHVALIGGVEHPMTVNPGCADTTAPTWPADAALTASGVGPDTATLTWTAAEDDVGVTGYRVHRGTTLVATLAATARTHEVTGLDAETAYAFRVQARDAAGNWSTGGPVVQVTTTANIPTWPAGARLLTDDVTGTSVTLRWTAAVDVEGVTGYRVAVDGSQVALLGAGDRSHVVDGLLPGATHTFEVQARDADGHWSADGPAATTTTDAFRPLETSSIRGAVYLDDNRNGVRDPDEQGVDPDVWPRVGFQAYRVDGSVQRSLMTLASGDDVGRYSFDNLDDGTWVVALVVWPRVQTSPSDLQPQLVEVVDGKGWQDVDFGLTQAEPFPTDGSGSLSGTVFADVDGDSVRDPGEGPLAGVGVGCYNVPLGAGCGGDARSDASGRWTLSDLLPGTLRIGTDLAVPEHHYPTSARRVVPLASGEVVGNVDLGFVEGTAQVGGVLYEDLDRDGVQDGDEVPAGAGFRVCARSLDADAERCALTDGSGAYSIDRFPHGRLHVVLEVPWGWEQTPGGGPRATTVQAGGTTRVDLGVVGPRGAISGVVFADSDRDGVRDAEEGPVAQARACLSGDGETFECVATDGGGGYRFDRLVADEYVLWADVPDGWVRTFPDHGNVVDLAEDAETVLDLGYARDGEAVPPGPPTEVTAVGSDRTVTLGWLPPADGGGSTVTGYVVETSADGETWAPAADVVDALAWTADGQANGTTLWLRVAARNEAGLGPWSPPVSATPVAPVTPPTAPVGLTALPGPGAVTLAWRPPAEDGGSTVTGYVVQRSTGTGPWSTVGNPATTTHVVTGLRNGTAYRFRVAAVSSAGTGPWSAVVQATPRAAVTEPGRPRDLRATARVVHRRALVRLRWRAPTSNGGAAITDYVVQRRAGSSWRTVRDPRTPATRATVRGLRPGRLTFRVAAVNAAGAGSWARVTVRAGRPRR